MHAQHDYIAYMKKMQYTIRQIDERLDNAVREEAQKYHLSINTVLLDALAKGLGTADQEMLYHDMDDLAGTWVDDDAFNAAVSDFEQIDETLWK